MNEAERNALLGILKTFYGEARYTGTSVITEDAPHTRRAIAAIRDLLAAADAPGMDELLDSVHEYAVIESLVWDEESGFDGDDRHEGEWVARIVWPLAARWEPLLDVGSADGTGTTRDEALLSAVAQATTMQEGARR